MARGAVRQQAIVDATLDLLAEVGYERLTVDAVAARARASKATIYRRWRSKAELVTEAMRVHAATDVAEPADADDLFDTLRAIRDRFGGKNRGLMIGLFNAAEHDPELAAPLRAELTAQKSAVGELIGEHAAVGGVDEATMKLVAEAGAAAIAVRMLITREPVDDDYLRSLVEHVMAPLLRLPADPPE